MNTNVIIVFDFETGACVMVRRNAYFEVGGLSNTFPLSFNDVDRVSSTAV